MDKKKFIVGKVESGDNKAKMSLYTDIDYWSTQDFISEFQWLERIGVQEVDILINSIGGSVVDGISIYSEIINSKMKCTTIIEGVAMSMGSIVWAAGDELKMKDYGILMIHNPFHTSGNTDKDTQTMLEAFKNQLKTIYMKRFKLDEETIVKIMDGEDGVDGTYFNPDDAVRAGFIKESDIITTNAIEKETVMNQLSNFSGSKLQYAKILAKAVESNPDNNTNKVDNIKIVKEKETTVQPKKQGDTIINKINKKDGGGTQTTQQNTKSMENQKLGFIVASLGLPQDSDADAIVASLNKMKSSNDELVKANKELENVKAELESKILGHETSIANLKSTVASQKTVIDEFEAKEQAKKDAEIEALVDNAIKDGKITEESKETWVTMAKSNFELAQGTLNSIEAKKSINEQIKEDSSGVKDAEDAKFKAEKTLSKKIEESPEFQAKMASLDLE